MGKIMKRLSRLREQRTDLATKHLTDQVKCETIEPKDEHETMFEYKQHNEPENFGIYEGLHGRTC
jgi:hypothetical protein